MSKSANKKVYRLPAHSLAKIECYRKYLQRYLSILANTPFSPIYIYDLFAGEGRDVDGKACSSIAAIEAFKVHYETAVTKCNSIRFFLNDSGDSVIEKDSKKIDRVKRLINEVGVPQNVIPEYSCEKIESLFPSIISRLNSLRNSERALCYIDPFGYKYSKPETLRELMANGKTEIILFIPICFMHRFAAKALKEDDYAEGKHIEDFILKLFEDRVPDIQNQVKFIKGVQQRFKGYLSIPYVDVMFIEKEKGQFFALFFFSNNKRGFQKMLEAKWAIDEDDGHGFKVNRGSITPSLFDSPDHEDYTYRLHSEIKTRGRMSNQEVFDYGLENNHLPKHSNKVLDELKREGKINVLTDSGGKSLGNYLEDNHDKTVFFTPTNN